MGSYLYTLRKTTKTAVIGKGRNKTKIAINPMLFSIKPAPGHDGMKEIERISGAAYQRWDNSDMPEYVSFGFGEGSPVYEGWNHHLVVAYDDEMDQADMKDGFGENAPKLIGWLTKPGRSWEITTVYRTESTGFDGSKINRTMFLDEVTGEVTTKTMVHGSFSV